VSATVPPNIPWVPYTNTSLREVTLCEETGQRATTEGFCPVHGGDACLYRYRHPYDNAIDMWRRPEWER
jgi:hypothetical protein